MDSIISIGQREFVVSEIKTLYDSANCLHGVVEFSSQHNSSLPCGAARRMVTTGCLRLDYAAAASHQKYCQGGLCYLKNITAVGKEA